MKYQGIFKPQNPNKYRGNVNLITYRSRWELKCMTYFDRNPNILEWSSEEDIIPYVSPLDNRYHRYFVDFRVKVKDRNGNIKTLLIEVKPFYQTQAPDASKINKKRYLAEVQTYVVNQSKWKAAKEHCDKKGWDFHIWTEKELNI